MNEIEVIQDLAGPGPGRMTRNRRKMSGGNDMFDKLEDLLIRFEEILNMLNEPSVIGDPQRFQKLMKEQSEPVSRS